MSVVIWKDGESELCEPEHLQYQLEAGYSLEEKPVKVKEPDEDKDIREQAKGLGIKSAHNKKISTLKDEIEGILNDSD